MIKLSDLYKKFTMSPGEMKVIMNASYKNQPQDPDPIKRLGCMKKKDNYVTILVHPNF